MASYHLCIDETINTLTNNSNIFITQLTNINTQQYITKNILQLQITKDSYNVLYLYNKQFYNDILK